MVLFRKWGQLVSGAIQSVVASAVPSHPVTLSGGNLTGTRTLGGFPFNRAEASIYVRADGTIDQSLVAGGVSQISPDTDWIIPNGDASSEYEVMVHEESNTLNTGFGDAVDTWLALSQDRNWGVEHFNAVGSYSCTITLSIRKNGGPVIDTGLYVLTAELT